MQHIYRSLIQLYLVYGITTSGQAGKTQGNIILRLQKRALRLMFFSDYKTHALPLFISSSLLTLDLIYFKSVVILMHDVSNNISPPQISNLFHYQHNIHSYITRSSTRGNFFLKYSKTNKQNMSFSKNGVRIWNSLSSKFHQMPKTKFKRNIHNMLLRKLSEANECINLSDLNMPWIPNLLYLRYPFSFSCNLYHFPMNFASFSFLSFPNAILVNIQLLSLLLLLLLILFSISLLFWVSLSDLYFVFIEHEYSRKLCGVNTWRLLLMVPV